MFISTSYSLLNRAFEPPLYAYCQYKTDSSVVLITLSIGRTRDNSLIDIRFEDTQKNQRGYPT